MADICVHCGKLATIFNKDQQPTCARCRDKPPKSYRCKKCGDAMIVKKGKYGSFWGCIGFPMCDNTASLREAFVKERNKANVK